MTGRLGAMIFGVVSAMALGALARGAVIYVHAGAIGLNTGESWVDAMTDLNAALAAAQHHDEVWVAAGTYRPGAAGGAREASFVIPSGAGLYGGFAGHETERGEKDPVANPTILSGDLNGDDGPEWTNRSDNSYHVVVAIDSAHGTTIDGFTVTGGHADGPGEGAHPESKDQGSGLNAFHGHLAIVSCTFTANWSGNHGAVNNHGHGGHVMDCVFIGNHSEGHGAGLYLHDEASVPVERCTFIDNDAVTDGAGSYSRAMGGAHYMDCRFENNRANRGAGQYNAVGAATLIEDCTFHENDAEVGGGGIYADFAALTVRNCMFTNNAAGVGITKGGGGGGGSGGGGVWYSGGTGLVTGSCFDGNLASFGAGVYYIDGSVATVEDSLFTNGSAEEAGGTYVLGSTVRVTGCTYVGNVAAGGPFSVGGGLSTYFAPGTSVDHCIFDGNSAELGGGGVYIEGETPPIDACAFVRNTSLGHPQGWGGGLMVSYFTGPAVTNCMFIANHAHRGGGIFFMPFATGSVVNCAVVQNSCEEAGHAGGAETWVFGTTLAMANTIVVGNEPANLVGPLEALEYSCIEGVTPDPAVGLIDADPEFVSAPSPGPDGVWRTEDDDFGDLSLSPGSPCIDAGNNARMPAGLLFDLMGLERFRDDLGVVDTGAGGPPVVDIGAQEFQGRTPGCPGDADGDGAVGLADVAVVIQHWTEPTDLGAAAGDLNADGVVGMADVVLVVMHWGVVCE